MKVESLIRMEYILNEGHLLSTIYIHIQILQTDPIHFLKE